MIKIDLTAERCPLVLVQVKLRLKQMNIGNQLHVLISDPGSRRDVPVYFEKIGQKVIVLEDKPECLSLIITKM